MDARDGRLQGGDVGDVALDEQRLWALIRQRARKRLARFALAVEEGHARAVAYKRGDDVGADAGGAAGDEDDAAGETGVGGEGHATGFNRQADALSTLRGAM